MTTKIANWYVRQMQDKGLLQTCSPFFMLAPTGVVQYVQWFKTLSKLELLLLGFDLYEDGIKKN